MYFFSKNGYVCSYILSCPEPDPIWTGPLAICQDSIKVSGWSKSMDWQEMYERLKKACKEVLTPEEYEEWEKKCNEPWPEDCLMRKFDEEQMKKPEEQRCYYAFLSCPCSRCSSGKL